MISCTRTLTITGVTDGSISTLGTLDINFLQDDQKFTHTFHVVDDDFPIQTDGILGLDFLINFKCTLDYENFTLYMNINQTQLTTPIHNNIITDEIALDARCEVIRCLKLSIQHDTVIHSQALSDGVFLASSIISPEFPFVRILNTTNNPVQIKNLLVSITPLSDYRIIHGQSKFANVAIINKHESNNDARTSHLLQMIKPNLPSYIQNSTLSALLNLLADYNEIFHVDGDNLTTNNFYEQTLHLTNDKPIYIKNYRTPHGHKDEIDRQVRNLLEQNIIGPSLSPFNSPVLLVPKKSLTGTKQWRLVVDFRQLNKRLVPDKFPLPRVDETLDELGRSKFFTTLDLQSGFHQIALDKKSRQFTAFSTGKGHFHYTRVPFGLNVAPNSFQRMMNLAMSGLPADICFIYLDDIIVTGCSELHHLQNLEKVFDQLRKRNLKLNPNKCAFFRHEIGFLGHTVTGEGILPDRSKYDVIERYPVPTNADETRRFTAFASYYRRFIPNFASLAQPLTKFTRKNVPFEWTAQQQAAFDRIKTLLKNPPILRYPDFSKSFYLTTDASMIGCGAVLQQMYGDTLLPVAYASKTFNKAESKKPPIELELMSIWHFVRHFRAYLLGKKFYILTDHKPLVHLYNLRDPSSKLTRMRLDLEEYDFDIGYIQGKTNVVADALSRISLKDLKHNRESNMNMIRRVAIRAVTTRAQARKAPTTTQITNQDDERIDHPQIIESLEGLRPSAHRLDTTIDEGSIKYSLEKGKKFLLQNKISCNTKNNSETFMAFEYILKEISRYLGKNTAATTATLSVSAHDDVWVVLGRPQINTLLQKYGMQIRLYTPRIVLTTPEEIENVLRQNHDSPLSGHIGQKRLYNKLKRLYTWPNMKKTIKKYVNKCIPCKLNKVTKHTREQLTQTTTPPKAMDTVSVDTIGPYEVSEKGNKFAITAQCDLTKYLILIPVPNKESRTVAQAIVEHIILVYGPIRILRHDQGTEYMSETIREILKLLHIEQRPSTAYHPQTIGGLERSHRVLNEYLRTYLGEAKYTWDKWLPYFQYCYNTTPHTSHNYTPFELLFGRLGSLPNSLTGTIDPLYNADDYSKEIKYRLQLTWNRARAMLTRNKQTRVQGDTNVNPIALCMGDQVKLSRENRHKFDSHYTGPYTVTDIQNVNVTITDGTGTQVVHKNRLVLY